MKWLVQELLNSAENTVRVAQGLETLGTKFLLIRLNKDETLTVIDNKTKIPLDNSEDLISKFIKDSNVMTYGTKKFDEVTRKMNLKPGSFVNDNFNLDRCNQELGNEMLNKDIIIGNLYELEPKDDVFFIRPLGNNKVINGGVITKEEFYKWRDSQDENYKGELLVISSNKSIKTEYRFFIVDKEIISGTSYNIEGEYNIEKEPTKEVLRYTEEVVNKYPLARAFVIDIAETDKGLKVVEHNNINTSGLYKSDELKIIQAINNMEV